MSSLLLPRVLPRLRLATLACQNTSKASLVTVAKNAANLKQRSLLQSHHLRPLGTTANMASKASDELAEFLSDEIAAERKNAKKLVELNGFVAENDGAEIKLTKQHGDEKIVIQLNVNHTVDSTDPETEEGSEEAPEMKSMPNFEVDITKPNGQTLSFTCSYVQGQNEGQPEAQDEQGYDDVFTIDEVTLYSGEWSESKYAVAGDILDGYLYDLFMKLLEERGITGDFAESLSDYCSAYEHGQYIDMLQNLQKFVKQ